MQIDESVPSGLAVHVSLYNLSVRKAPEIAKRLAHLARQHWHLHFTPTSIQWSNLAEHWFKERTDGRLHRGTFTSEAARHSTARTIQRQTISAVMERYLRRPATLPPQPRNARLAYPVV